VKQTDIPDLWLTVKAITVKSHVHFTAVLPSALFPIHTVLP